MGFSGCTNLFFVLIMPCFFFSDVGASTDTITSSQFIKDPETITSRDGNFTLGFFTPQNSTKRYVGIWWKSDESTVIWVANRNQPLNDSSGVVTISEDSNLVVLNGKKHVIWSTNVSNLGSKCTSKLLDSGNLVLVESTTGSNVWESFQHPCNALLPNMKLTTNKVTGEKVKLTSWKSASDASTGSFSASLERLSIPEVFIWNETRPFWRTGPWNGKSFIGIPNMKTHYLNGINVEDDGQENIQFYFTKVDVGLSITILNSQGNMEERLWNEEDKKWLVIWNGHQSDCDIYGVCGPFASCDSQSSPTCSCLKGFEPRNKEEWNRQKWTGGCVRSKSLQCERVGSQNQSADNKADGFLKLSMVKAPDFADRSSLSLQPDTCRSRCVENCSCIAYSYDAQIGCMSWTGNLIDITQFSNGGLELYIRVAYTELDKERNRIGIITIITVTTGITLLVICAYIKWRRISNHHGSI